MTLELNQGMVYGARYWTVKPILEFDNIWRANLTPWRGMMEWCVETFGPAPEDGVWTPGARWYANNAKFWFSAEADRDWFLLKWA
jgi:hypothetical protein